MDISKITDIDQLKSMAYDQIGELERVKANINLLNQRIVEVENIARKENQKPKKDK